MYSDAVNAQMLTKISIWVVIFIITCRGSTTRINQYRKSREINRKEINYNSYENKNYV